MPKLLLLPPAPVIRMNGDRIRLDKKFVEGMSETCASWPGPVDCILREGASSIPFGAEFEPSDLPFGLTVIGAAEMILPAVLKDYDIVQASADTHFDLGLGKRTPESPARRVFVIEYTLATRLEILKLDRGVSLIRKARRAIWLFQQEMRRRRALTSADAIQVNGYPAYDSYRRLNANTLLYLDNRMRAEMLSNPAEIAARKDAIRAGAPIRLINSGRLEPMKGAQDLLPVARALAALGVNFTLDIYGAGSLESEIRAGIQSFGLQDKVRLHQPVDFESELVPISRQNADLFLSCHRQSDPSCTYLEAMGCGLPVAGYANQMLSRLVETSRAGWTAPLADVDALAAVIADVASQPDMLQSTSENALAFARQHDFASEFDLRHQHMLALLDDAEAPGDDATTTLKHR